MRGETGGQKRGSEVIALIPMREGGLRKDSRQWGWRSGKETFLRGNLTELSDWMWEERKRGKHR